MNSVKVNPQIRKTGAFRYPGGTIEQGRHKLAIVLSGAVDRGFAHIGMLEVLDDMGIKPDVVIGTSSGAIMGSIYSVFGNVKELKARAYEVLSKYSWQDLMDPDFAGLRHITTDPGLCYGNKLRDVISGVGGLGDKTFRDTKFDFYVVGAALKHADGYVFCDTKTVNDKLIDPLRKNRDSFNHRSAPDIFPGTIKLADAVRATFGIQGVFKPYVIEHRGKRYEFIDGGNADNCAIDVATALKGVDRVIAFNMGYPGELEKNFSEADMLTVVMQGQSMQGYKLTKKILENSISKGVSIRVINPGLFNVKTPDAYDHAQDLILSARRTMKMVMDITKDPEAALERFFSPWSRHTMTQFNEHHMTVRQYMDNETGSRNVFTVLDTKPLIKEPIYSKKWKDEFKIEEKATGTKYVITKAPAKSIYQWIFRAMAGSYGTLMAMVYAAWAFANLAFLKIFFLKEKKKV